MRGESERRCRAFAAACVFAVVVSAQRRASFFGTAVQSKTSYVSIYVGV